MTGISVMDLFRTRSGIIVEFWTTVQSTEHFKETVSPPVGPSNSSLYRSYEYPFNKKPLNERIRQQDRSDADNNSCRLDGDFQPGNV